AAARVGEDVAGNTVAGVALQSADDAPALAEQLAVDHHAGERDDARAPGADLFEQRPAPARIIGAAEIGHAGGRARDQVRDPETARGQVPVVEVARAGREETRVDHEPPESVRGPGEMMPHLGRAQPGVEPYEQDAA